MSRDLIMQIARFGVSGVTALATNIGVLYVLNSVIGLWYLAASVVGFLAGFAVSFTLQKFWTFRDHSTDKIAAQAVRYFLIVLFNLGLNTILVYLLVEHMHIRPVISQIIAAFIIAVEGFFAYRILVFNAPHAQARPEGASEAGYF